MYTTNCYIPVPGYYFLHGSKENSTSYENKPTVLPASHFNAAADGDALRAAMKGFGTNEKVIINILPARSNDQRQVIAKYFETQLNRNLIKDLKSELSGNFKEFIIGLMMPPTEYLCNQLHKSLSGLSTNNRALIDILCTKRNFELKDIVTTYERIHKRPLVEHICNNTSGDFRRLLTLIVTCVRNEFEVNANKAKEQAEELYKAGEAKLGTDESVFNQIMTHNSFDQLRLIFESYKTVSERTIEQAIHNELSGSYKDAMLAIIEWVQSPPSYLAKCLNKSMKGLGTDDGTLIRIIVSRSEIDLQNIKEHYERLYDHTLMSDVKSDTSGDYQKALCAVIGNA